MTSAQIYMANVGAMLRIDRRVTPWWLWPMMARMLTMSVPGWTRSEKPQP